MTTKLLNRKQVKQYAMDTAASTRAHKFTRVGSEFYLMCDAHLQEFIRGYISRLPSVGKTIK